MSSAIDAAGRLREPTGWVNPAESLPGTRGRLLTVVLVSGQDLHLLFQEFELLEFLTEHPHRALTREEILAGAWGGRQRDTPTRTVDVHIHRLRRKLGPDHARSLVTVRRVGYLYRPPVPRAS
jgi:DNA-binding response OmpR family regulator